MNESFKKTFGATLGVVSAVLIGSVVANVLNVGLPLKHENAPYPAEFSVNADGEVEVVPNVAVLNGGVTVSKVATEKLAQDELSKKNNAILASIKALGVPEGDITTSGFSIYQDYTYEPSGKATPTTYSGNVSLTVKVKQADTKKELVSKVQAAMTDSGANSFYGIDYEVEDMTAYKEQAREMAIKKAKEQAKKLEKELGVRLGKITNFMEAPSYDGGAPYPIYSARADMAPSKESAPIEFEGGKQKIKTNVTLYFERQ